MAKIGARRLANYLSDEVFARLGRQLEWLQILERVWAARVASPLSSHTRPVSYRSGRLIVHAESSVWANRLRHQRAGVIAAVRKEPVLEGLLELTVRVAPSGAVREAATPRRPAKTPGRLSESAAALIKAMASDVHDPELRSALERLGSHPGKGRRDRS
jgi:predicted nucleic acid-binding Zn ribbon protein